jgi:hypothetical protein
MPFSARAMLAVSLLWSASLPAWGQYFGRNKVQYGTTDFSVLSTEHFQIFHYPPGAQAVMDAARILESAYARHADSFGYGIKGLQKVILYDSVIDFEQTNVIPGSISLGEGGVTESLGHRIVLPLTGTYSENAHVLTHELVHAFQFQKMGAGADSQPLPPWLVEGQAEYLSLGPDDPLTDMWMRDAVLNKDIPGIGDLSSRQSRYFPYRFGDAFWYWIDRGWGKSGMRSFFNDAAEKGISQAVTDALGVKSMKDFDARWKADVSDTYAPGIAGRALPQDVGRKLPGLDSGYNLSPVISPDGKYIAVFSQRDLFGLDLFLADAGSGKVLKNLASSENDARYDVLNFIDSAGAWSPDSRSFAFVVEKGGQDAVGLVEVPTGKLVKIIPLGSIKGAAGLAWSPDGSRIALSGTQDGLRDIYVLDPAGGGIERLTSGWHTKLQPSWSPDGKTIAFATDYGAHTDIGTLTFQSMNIGLLDVLTRQIRILSVKDGAKHINPVYSPDGKSLYFVADTDGYSDVYRYSFETGQFFRVTNVATGVSGLTPLSPCLSIAGDSAKLVLTIFNNRKYEVHEMDLDQAQGEPVSLDGAISSPSIVEDNQAASAPGLSGTQLSPYTTTFSLLGATQVAVGLGVSPFGTSLGGAAALSFADVTGNHEIDAAVQGSSTLDSVGAAVTYVNKAGRINWGGSFAHIPQVSYVSLDPSQFTISPTLVDTGILQETVFQEEVDLSAEYPLTINRRWEAGIGYTRYWWEGVAPISYYRSGQPVATDQVTVATPPPVDLLHAEVAYVGDYSYFGFTSPIKGYSYRFELDQDLGTTDFLTALADVREYLFLNPVTIAFRALHVGRYFGGADSTALSPFYVGEPDLVRGYEYYSIASIEGARATGDIPQVDRLFGSKIAVLNLELRIPVVGNDALGLLDFPWVPIELAGFLDGGVAWTDSQPPILRLSTDQFARVPVFSAGAALRVNILDALVLQIYWAWPFERQDIGGDWGLVLESGW